MPREFVYFSLSMCALLFILSLLSVPFSPLASFARGSERENDAAIYYSTYNANPLRHIHSINSAGPLGAANKTVKSFN